MARISTLLFTALSFFIFSQRLHAQEVEHGLTWYTDVHKVYELSQQTKKPVFAFFTGSDWCGWCHRLEANVFDKPGFQAWAKSNVILLELDYPRRKQLPEELVKQNSELQQFFQVQGYPTIWLFNMARDAANGKMNISAFGSLGYPDGPAGNEEQVFLANVKSILKNKNKK